MRQTVSIPVSIPADHPSLPGHFPGHPVVPGAVILAEIVHAASAALGAAHVAGFPSVKFMSPMLPDQRCELTLTDKGDGNMSFELAYQGQRLASGSLRYERLAER